jgi:hypothetical protein
MRVPYPLGFFTKWLDGRIDDPHGLEGRGLWTTVSTRAPFHMEGGKGRQQGDEVPASSGPSVEIVRVGEAARSVVEDGTEKQREVDHEGCRSA